MISRAGLAKNRGPMAMLTVVLIMASVVLLFLGGNSFRVYVDVKEAIGQAVRLENLRGTILHLDEVLTMSARMATTTGDVSWETRYLQFEPTLDAVINEAMTLVADPRENVTQTNAANIKLVEMEKRAFALVRMGRVDEAHSLLFSDEYERQKQIYSEGIHAFDEALSDDITLMLEDNRRQVFLNGLALALLIPLLIAAWVVMIRAVRRWEANLSETNRQLNRQTLDLEEANRLLDTRVNERTQELETSRAAMVRDIAERKRVEETLRDSEERLRAIYDHSNDAIFLLDLEHDRILDFNQAAVKLLGYSPQELLRVPISTVHPHEMETFKSFAQSVRERGGGKTEDLTCLTKSGELILAELSASYVEIKGRSYLLALVRDITERKRAEEEKQVLEVHLRQQQKLEAIGTLAGGVAHEINNPITGIMNYAQLISDRLDPESPLREFAGEIGSETERVARIVRNLLAFARQEKESHSPANITDILNDTLSLIRTIIGRDQIVLEVDALEDLPRIKCRSQQIQQVLLNLLTNARDALNERYPEYDPDKIIAVTIRPFEREGRQWVRTTVEDHGAGIAEEIRTRLFDPFFTTKDRTKGTGLGLSISHGIVQDHHGELRVECEPGEYTRFHLELPVDNGWELK